MKHAMLACGMLDASPGRTDADKMGKEWIANHVS